MGKKASRAATPALAVLADKGINHTVHSFDAGSDHFGQHAADALTEIGVKEGQVFKTLVLACEGLNHRPPLAVVCVPVTTTVSLKKAAAALGARKAAMAEEKVACRATGYVFGGTSPIGQKTSLPTIVDSSAEQWDQVCVSAGKRGMDVMLAPADLLQATGGSFADIAHD